MIEHISLKFGSSPGQLPLTFKLTPVTIFVGPNNSGKSKVISEIGIDCRSGNQNASNVILSTLTFEYHSPDESLKIVNQMTLPLLPNEALIQGHILIGLHGTRQQVNGQQLIGALTNPNHPSYRNIFTQQYLGSRTLALTAMNRVNLVNDQSAGDLQQPPSSSFQILFRNNDLRERLSEIVHKTLGSYLVVDPTDLGRLRLRLSKSAPPSPVIERGLDTASIQFHAAASHIATASDGAKAFVGILLELLAGNPDILLLDEPEAFLHPALAFTLGQVIAQSLAISNKRLFVSTHSPQFLMGCIQAGVPINVVRLTYRDDVATARLLPSSEIVKLMRNPLLRSTGVISALFYESVVVTEADADRAFYQEINERLLRDSRGIPNCVFLNAQNIQTIPTIVDPLRNLGIPTAAIYDIDFVTNGGNVASRFMNGAGIPQLSQQGLNVIRLAVSKALESANPAYKTFGGIAVLDEANKEAASGYFDQLDAYGAFVVRGGELEAWLRGFAVGGHGPSWLVAMFERIGEDPGSADYLQPTEDDVWVFLDAIRRWLLDPRRKGIPS